MSNHEEHKNGDGREPNRKPEIGRDDVQDLIDFGDSDDEFEIEEESEGSIEMQVVDETAQLLAQDDYTSSDSIEEVDGDLPEVLYDFDPEIQGVALEGEQVVVEQQVSDLAGVLIEMVAEQSENQLVEEGPDQKELDCGETEEEAPPLRSMAIHGQEGNSSNQGQEEPAEIREPSNQSSGNESLEPLTSGDSEIVKDGIGEPSGSSHDPCLNGEPSEQGSNDQDHNGGSSSSEPCAENQDQNGRSSRSGPCAEDQDQNGKSSSSGPCAQDQNQNGSDDQDQNRESSSSGPCAEDQNQNGGSSSFESCAEDQDQNGRSSSSGSCAEDQDQNGRSSSSGSCAEDQDQNGGSSRSEPCAEDQDRNGGSSSSGPCAEDQNQSGGSSGSRPCAEDQDQNEPSRLGRCPVVDRNLHKLSSEGLNRGLKEGPSESGRGSFDQIQNGGPSRSRQGSNNDDRNNGSPRPVQSLYRNLNEEPSSQSLKVGPSESGQGPTDQVQNDGLRSVQGSNEQDRNCRTPRLRQGPIVDLNEGSSGSGQGLKERPSEPNRRQFAQNRNELSSASARGIVEQDIEGLYPGALVPRMNEQQSTSSYDFNRESPDRASNKGKLNGGPSRPDEDPVEQQIQEDEDACEEIMEQLELNEDEVEVNVQARPIPGIGIPECDIGLRDQIVEAADAMAHQEMAVDLNGEPDSGPDPGEQREKVEQVAVNEGAVVPPEVVVERPEDHIDAVLDQNEDILLDEQDNLVEEVQILHAPLEEAVGGHDHVVVEEQDTAAEAQLIQKTE